MSTTTLGIDFGSQSIGLALVRNEEGENVPLFAGTITYDPVQLKKKLNPRPQLRRLRRTRKTKHSRLRKLEHGLMSAGLEDSLAKQLVAFCRRRGWKSLFGEKKTSADDAKSKDEEILFRFTREEFFEALEQEIEERVPKSQQTEVLKVCESVLNRQGDPYKEMRLIRIDNRGVSRCAWEGCNSVTPRRDNAIQDALAQFVYAIIDRERLLKENLREALDATLERLATLGKRLRNAGGNNPPEDQKERTKAERKALLKQVRSELKLIKDLANEHTWATNRANIINILEKSRGRNRYCCKHSAEFIDHWLQGKAIPFKTSLTERDLISRREEVLYQKLWRYIEARLLPLSLNGIDRLVVERVAFDLLAGTGKQRQKVGDKALEEMYQQGPRLGFKSNLEMLKAEFGGLCAYCGKECESILEQEHILPRSEFTFDSYLNLVPSCPTCNRQLKSKRSPGAAGLTIHPKAYEAYQEYLKSKFRNKPPHHLHNIKKGILKLMTNPERSWEAEQYLSLIAKNYLEMTGTQRGPRPLARYLSGKIKRHLGQQPKIVFFSGRHTALWRDVSYPKFDKARDKAEGSTVNHAVDALILASILPSPTQLEGLNLPVRSLKSWSEKVRRTAPIAGPLGIPELPEPSFAIPGFEKVLTGNYVQTDLSFLNWNRTNTRVQRQDIYGWNHYANTPTRRIAASELVASFIEADKKSSSEASKLVENIIHPHLKVVLKSQLCKASPGKACASTLTDWLRKSLKGSLAKATFSLHPADQGRKSALQKFVAGESDVIPVTVGITMLKTDKIRAIDLSRADKNGNIIHRYYSDPSNIARIVGYRKNKKGIDRSKPIVYDWRQSWAILPASKSKTIPPVPDGPLKGRSFGQAQPDPQEWIDSLERYLATLGVVEYAVVRQGSVVQYEDGSQRYIRNFSATQGFKTSFLKSIVGVKKSPFVDRVVPNAVVG